MYIPASILYKSTAGRYRPVSYPDGPITVSCRFIKNAYWDITEKYFSFNLPQVSEWTVLFVDFIILCDSLLRRNEKMKKKNTLISDAGITKTYLCNFDSLKPHFYIAKLGFTGIYIIFLISAQEHRLWIFVRTASAR